MGEPVPGLWVVVMTAPGLALLEAAERENTPETRRELADFARGKDVPVEVADRVRAALLVDGARVRWISTARYSTRACDAFENSPPGEQTEIGDLGVLRLTTMYGAPSWRFERDDGFDTFGPACVLSALVGSFEDERGPAVRPAPNGARRAELARENDAEVANRQKCFRAETLRLRLDRDPHAVTDPELVELALLAPDLAHRIERIGVAREHDRIRAEKNAAIRAEVEAGGKAWAKLRRSVARKNAARREAWDSCAIAMYQAGISSLQVDRIFYRAGICEPGSVPDLERIRKAYQEVTGIDPRRVR